MSIADVSLSGRSKAPPPADTALRAHEKMPGTRGHPGRRKCLRLVRLRLDGLQTHPHVLGSFGLHSDGAARPAHLAVVDAGYDDSPLTFRQVGEAEAPV